MSLGNILLISGNVQDRAFSEAAAEGAGANLVMIPTFAELEPYIANNDYSAVIIDASAPYLQALTSSFSGRIDANRVHALMSPEETGLDAIFNHPDIGSVAVRRFLTSPQAPTEAGRHYARIIRASGRNSAFNGVADFLPAGTDILNRVLTESSQKNAVAEEIGNHLVNAHEWQAKMAASVSDAVDELLMNAAFDAPVDENGAQLYQALPRNTNLVFADDHRIRLDLGVDGRYTAVSVTDFNGTLNRRQVMKYVAKCYAGKQGITRSVRLQGAGLGLALVMRAGGSLCFSCVPGKRTEVTCFFRRTVSHMDFKNQFQFMSTLIHPGT